VAPLAGAAGPTAAWLALAATGAALTAFAAGLFPKGRAAISRGFPLARGPLLLLLAAYACDAVGFIPHSVFLADYVARGLGQGLAAGAFFWAVFGLGATLGPVLVGLAADRFGFAASLCGAFLLKAAAVALPLASSTAAALAASSFLVGALTTGVVALAAGRSAELAGPEGRMQAWGAMTAAFAVSQAAGAYAFTALFAATEAHRPLFALGALALLLGAGLERLSARRR
jgi:predicted MFS family arabinose efflux permease